MTDDTVIPFLRTHSFELRSADGRRWCANAYMPRGGLDRMTPGRTYSLYQLRKEYGMYPRTDGRPGLYIEEGEDYPAELTYVVERLG